jgi:hypothetical protein
MALPGGQDILLILLAVAVLAIVVFVRHKRKD